MKCGCPWRYLPADFPRWQTVYHVFRQWVHNHQWAVLLGGASVKLFLPIFKMNFPEIVDIALPAEGVFHNLVFVSLKKI